MTAKRERFPSVPKLRSFLREMAVGTDGELGCSPVRPFIPRNPGTNRNKRD